MPGSAGSSDSSRQGSQKRVPRSPQPRLPVRQMFPPDSTYLNMANERSTTVAANKASKLEPLILAFPLDGTLVCRREVSHEASREPFKRPYLSCFLSYLFASRGRVAGSAELTRRATQIVVFTGTRAHNVLLILKSLNLTLPGRQSPFGQPYRVDSAQGDLVDLALCREDLGLGEDYYNNVDTVKDLRKVWERLGVEVADGVKRTVLVSNSAADAVSLRVPDTTRLRLAAHLAAPLSVRLPTYRLRSLILCSPLELSCLKKDSRRPPTTGCSRALLRSMLSAAKPTSPRFSGPAGSKRSAALWRPLVNTERRIRPGLGTPISSNRAKQSAAHSVSRSMRRTTPSGANTSVSRPLRRPTRSNEATFASSRSTAATNRALRGTIECAFRCFALVSVAVK